VNEKLGFKTEGCLRNFECEHGKPIDIVIMSITREDYKAQRADGANPCALGTYGTLAAEQPLVP